MNAHVVEFLRWLVGDTDDLPARPSPPDKPGNGDHGPKGRSA
ncbi:hypothetical protein [Streptomyces sp. HYC2]|nr:hypothetical protein [Streptomyces sp. HYC2]